MRIAFALAVLPIPLTVIFQSGNPPGIPAGATVLFGGNEADLVANWVRRAASTSPSWKVKSGAMIASGGDIVTKQSFEDFQLHVEFKVPLMPDRRGQSRGNSGVKLQGRYEIQILDSYGKAEPGTGDCGAVYTLAAPLINASRPPEEWQSFDISFRAPRVDSGGSVTESGLVTVIHNGTAIQNNVAIGKPTGNRPLDRDVGKPGPILLQDHRCPVEFRNIWILQLPREGSKKY